MTSKFSIDVSHLHSNVGDIALRGRSRTYSREEDRKKRTTNVIPL